jgi:hypothetical protein
MGGLLLALGLVMFALLTSYSTRDEAQYVFTKQKCVSCIYLVRLPDLCRTHHIQMTTTTTNPPVVFFVNVGMAIGI